MLIDLSTSTSVSDLGSDVRNETTPCTVRDYANRLTDWRPRCAQHAELYAHVSKDMPKFSSYEMREWVTTKGDVLARKQKAEIEKYVADNGLCPTYGTGMPDYKYIVRCDKVSCERRMVNPNGWGTGYEMVSPDARQQPRQQPTQDKVLSQKPHRA